ncbi:uncharacterized protein UHO2_00388 [Ustilago hordei]|uniref:uncharacterized protein n=1 Tax=Ustilago hordei TaxID=120017 RepID=UPI001A514BAC|nr:uncharacterized protein UHO2_00388 [Ustilago hordei]SYW81884.1 uncharacterized protein UHO2_00388 [Ustilago hordei]
MPLQPNEPHPANDPSLEDSSDDQAKMILDTPKLTMKNWYAWDPCFQDILALWSLALKHLNSTTKPGDKRTHKLYTQLKKDLTKMEHIAKSTLLYEAGRIHMFNVDVCKFSTDLNEHWAKAKAMGFNLTRVLKIRTLINQASVMTAYNNCIMNLQDNG